MKKAHKIQGIIFLILEYQKTERGLNMMEALHPTETGSLCSLPVQKAAGYMLEHLVISCMVWTKGMGGPLVGEILVGEGESEALRTTMKMEIHTQRAAAALGCCRPRSCEQGTRLEPQRMPARDLDTQVVEKTFGLLGFHNCQIVGIQDKDLLTPHGERNCYCLGSPYVLGRAPWRLQGEGSRCFFGPQQPKLDCNLQPRRAEHRELSQVDISLPGK